MSEIEKLVKACMALEITLKVTISFDDETQRSVVAIESRRFPQNVYAATLEEAATLALKALRDDAWRRLEYARSEVAKIDEVAS